MSQIAFIIGTILGTGVSYFLFKSKLDYEKRHRKTLAGKYAEKFVPYLSNYSYEPADTYFLGMPLDLIVFDGLNDGKVKQVVFIEIKTSKSQNTKRENSIMDAVRNGKVTWEEVRL